jgi:hypothetical protein
MMQQLVRPVLLATPRCHTVLIVLSVLRAPTLLVACHAFLAQAELTQIQELACARLVHKTCSRMKARHLVHPVLPDY